jgi:hypothetical protein
MKNAAVSKRQNFPSNPIGAWTNSVLLSGTSGLHSEAWDSRKASQGIGPVFNADRPGIGCRILKRRRAQARRVGKSWRSGLPERPSGWEDGRTKKWGLP